jgi:hypothetical protein
MQVTVGICTCGRDALLQQVLERLVDIDLGPLAPDLSLRSLGIFRADLAVADPASH